jgi:hypothetical protein
MTSPNSSDSARDTPRSEPGDATPETSEAAPGTGPGAPQTTEEESAADPGSGPGAPQR